MRTISIAATKGGAGKSTLATLLAVQAAHVGNKVWLLDFDSGQGTITKWSILRARAKLNGPEIDGVSNINSALRRLQKKGNVDLVFIDSPPTLDDTGIVESVVEVADVILSPCRPTIYDVGSTETIAELARPKPIGFVMSDVTEEWTRMNRQLARVLQDVGHVFKSQITHRASYANAPLVGKTGAETDRVAHAEVTALWEEISGWMKL